MVRFIGMILAALLAFAVPAQAQGVFPSRPVRIIMPFPPGSGTDILARIIANQLQAKWGQSVIVDNMQGGGGNIGGSHVARAAPDGTTLLFVPAPPLVIYPFVYKSLGYDPTKMAPITMVGSVPYALATRPDFPANNLHEFIDYVRARPGKITYASSSVGSTAQLAAVQFENMAGLDMVHVPYRGAAPALSAVMGSQVDLVFDIVSTTKPILAAGKVKVLGVGAKTRSFLMPDVPTIAEAGLPGYEALTWFGMVAPPNTPEAITHKISADVADVLKMPDIVKQIHDMGIDIAAMTPEQSAKFFADETVHWGNLVKKAGIQLE